MPEHEPLKPWSGDSPADAAPEEGSHGYLWMAGLACGLIIAVGSQALMGHFAERPALAAADPLMVSLIGAGRWGGGLLAGLSLAGWIWSLGKRPQ